MSEELKKDLEFIAEVIEEFVKKHRGELDYKGYLTLYHIEGGISIGNAENIGYYKRIKW